MADPKAQPMKIPSLQELPPLPELRLARIPTSSQPLYRGDRFSFLEKGPKTAPVILMLHGIGAHAAYFRFQLDELCANHRVIAWNAPGYMLSDGFKHEKIQASDYAQAVSDFAEALGLDRFILTGNSFGSAVAQAFALTSPERVQALVMTGTGVGQIQLSPSRRDAFLNRIERVQFGGYQYADSGIDHMIGPDTPQIVRQMMLEITRAIQPLGLRQAVSFRLSDFYTPALAHRLNMPVLLVQGDLDRINPREENADLLLSQLAKGSLEIWANTGHLPEIEQPLRFSRSLLSFLQKHLVNH
jgi:pimeloyl-ACP methyl ester carboxylesterase